MVLVWKTESLLRSLAVILQPSEPYNRVESTQVWNSFSLVFVLYCLDLQTLLCILKAFLALLRRFFTSLPAPLSHLSVLPKLVNFSVVRRSSPFTCTGAERGVVGAWGLGMDVQCRHVFFWLILRPLCSPYELWRDVFCWLCWWVWDTRAKSSAKSRSSSAVKRVHRIPLADLPLFVASPSQ